MCSVGINYFTLLALAETSYGNKTIILDIIYQESIEKTSEVIEFAQYSINHQEIIVDMEQAYLNNGNKDILEQLNNQIDLILQKKNDIFEFNETIKFNRNKKELLIMTEIIEAYEKIKREINVYEYISKKFNEDVEKTSNELKELCLQFEQLEKDIENSDKKELYEDELQKINCKIQTIQEFFVNSSQIQLQVKVNNKSLEEINKTQEFINMKMLELTNQTKETQEYWIHREKFLL